METTASNQNTGSNPTVGTSQSTARSIRGKNDPAWAYVSEGQDADGKKKLVCNFCNKVVKGGGINRMKKHLAWITGDIAKCKKVTPEVCQQMQAQMNEFLAQKKAATLDEESMNPLDANICEFDSDIIGDDIEILSGSGAHVGVGNKRKGKEAVNLSKKPKPSSVGSYFPSGQSQPTLKATLQSKEKWHRADLAVARFFYDACIPMNAANSYYFQQMFDAIASMGVGYKAPSYHALRTNLLVDAKKEVQLLIDTYRSFWAGSGCTIMADGWKDNRQRSLINFLVYCPKGTCFIKSVDASDMISNADTLCKLFSDIVEHVGPSNVVQLITDNAANYKAAGSKLNEKYPSILWTPCAAHCINLILKDMAQLEFVEELSHKVTSVTKFVYNHKWTLSWVRQRKGWTEILRPGDTPFATVFIAMKSLYDHMSDLMAMVISKEFLSWSGSKTKKANDVKEIILDTHFWNNCLVIVKVVGPLIRLLRLVDSDEKPALGYVYDGMFRARKAIIETFRGKKKMYAPYINILDERWKKQLRQDIHAAAYWLNPIFQYSTEKPCESTDVWTGFMNILNNRHISSGDDELLVDSNLFRDRTGTFGGRLAFSSYTKTRPDQWWDFHGHDAPKLRRLAIRILSQTASSSGCERNWNVFERIHTKKRNRLEHERLSSLVYVHYNLRLKNRTFNKNKSIDPIDHEAIGEIDGWIIEDETELNSDFDIEDLEQMVVEGDVNSDSEEENMDANEGDGNDDKDGDGCLKDSRLLDLSSFGDYNDEKDDDEEDDDF